MKNVPNHQPEYVPFPNFPTDLTPDHCDHCRPSPSSSRASMTFAMELCKKRMTSARCSLEIAL